MPEKHLLIPNFDLNTHVIFDDYATRTCSKIRANFCLFSLMNNLVTYLC